MMLRIYLIVEEGADRVFVQTTYPTWYTAPEGKKRRIIAVDVPIEDVERVDQCIVISPDAVRDMVPCEHCKRPEDAVNHVPGHVFVGWGRGWQPCPHCGGTEQVPASSE
jgi:hypothetical protein